MGILTDQNLLPLKKFLDERLPRLTQVDKENLKRFILALLTKKESREQIKSSCIKELKVFCEKDAHIDFVDSLFDKIDELDGKKVTPHKPLDSESHIQKERRKSSSRSQRSTKKLEKDSQPEKDSSEKGKRGSKKTNGEYKSSINVTTSTNDSGGRTVSDEGRHRSKRRSRDGSKDRESSKKRRRRDKSLSSRSPSPDPIITEKELRRLIKDNADEDDYRQILNNPKLLQSYVDAINSESFEFLGGGLTKDWKSKLDDHILPLPPFGLEPAPNPPALIADDIRAQVRLDRRLPPTRDPFYQPPDDYVNPTPLELPKPPPSQNRSSHFQRKIQTRKPPPDRRNVFIRNIPVEKNKIVTLNEFFSKFGSIENLQVHADRNKAFVQFSSPEEAEKCVAECQNTVVMDDTRISVHWAYYNRPDFNRNAFSKDVHRGLGRGRGRGRLRAGRGFGRGRGQDHSIKFNPGPIPQIFADEYVNMDRPTNGLYAKTPSQIGPRKVKPKRATLAFLDKSKIDKIEYSGENKDDATTKEPKKEVKEEPTEDNLKKSNTSSNEKIVKEIKPIATAVIRKTPSEEQLSLTKVVDKQIDVCKTQRDKQMEMWEKLVKMKAKSKDKKEFQSELSKSIKELHEKLSKLMEKKKQLILKASTRARLPWRGNWRGYRGRARAGYRGRGRGRARGAFYGSQNLVVDNRSPTLKIDELPETVSEFDLMTHFAKFGKVSSITLSGGVAKVDFMTRKDAEMALLKGRVIDGHIDQKIILKMNFL